MLLFRNRHLGLGCLQTWDKDSFDELPDVFKARFYNPNLFRSIERAYVWISKKDCKQIGWFWRQIFKLQTIYIASIILALIVREAWRISNAKN